jgi:hypothetical protein
MNLNQNFIYNNDNNLLSYNNSAPTVSATTTPTANENDYELVSL